MHATTSHIILYVLLFVAVLTAIDFYAFRGVKAAFSFVQSEKIQQVISWIYWSVNISLLVGIAFALFTFDKHNGPNKTIFSILASVLILFLIPKLVVCVVLLFEDVFRLLAAFGLFIGRMLGAPTTEDSFYFADRRQFLSQVALGLASIPFFSILYGVTKGKYNYTVHRVNLKFKNLPEKFNGLRITQISDMHVGSFDNEEGVKRGINLVNEQKSDLIFFTGDMVNNLASEMEPWLNHFKQLNAPMGMYSILGNHDYGDYIEWDSLEDKKKNLDSLKSIHKELGFRLLLNENISIKRDDEEINLIGIENWGSGGFAKYGDLNMALNGITSDGFKILLSHDPSHWDAQTLKHKEHIHLTLAGHTHGMQFGVEIPAVNIKWSPVKYRYPRWAGLYEEAGKYIYVNRGFGFIGFPGRVGIWPEVTVITLERA